MPESQSDTYVIGPDDLEAVLSQYRGARGGGYPDEEVSQVVVQSQTPPVSREVGDPVAAVLMHTRDARDENDHTLTVVNGGTHEDFADK